jgi:hypothetical protein
MTHWDDEREPEQPDDWDDDEEAWEILFDRENPGSGDSGRVERRLRHTGSSPIPRSLAHDPLDR